MFCAKTLYKLFTLKKHKGEFNCDSFAIKYVHLYGLKNSRNSISKNDSQDSIDQQWEMLKSAIDSTGIIEKEESKPRKAIIQHLDNHQCMVQGQREFKLRGNLFRQILCARWGQRPKHWIDFEKNWKTWSVKKNKMVDKKSVRKCISGWRGQKFLLIEAVDKDTVKKNKAVDKDIPIATEVANMLHLNHTIYG